MNAEIDVRDVLPTISVPTLVLHRARRKLARRVSIHGRAHPGRAHGRAAGQRPPAVGGRRGSAARRDRALPVGCSRGRGAGPRARHARCSPTSSDPRRRRPSSATPPGTTCSPGTIASCARSSRASAATRSTSAGDGVFATFDGPARAVRCASAIADGLRALGLDVRAGVHTGEIEQANGSVRGIAVAHRRANRRGRPPGRGARVEHGQGHRRRLGHRLRGARRARADGVPGTWRLFAALA